MNNFEQLIRKAQRLFLAGDFSRSMHACQQCMKLDSKSPLPWQLAGTIQGKAGNFVEAGRYFRKVIEINPMIPEAWYYLAIALVYTGDTNDEVLAAFRKSVELNKSFVSGWIGMGNYLRDRGRLDEAISAFQSAASADTKSAEPLLSLGFIYRNSGNYPKSLEYFERVLALQPGHPSATAGKASVLFRLGQKNESLELISAIAGTKCTDLLVAQAYAEIAKTPEMMRNALEYIDLVLKKTQPVQIQADEMRFSAARLSDRIGEYDRAFSYLKKANASRSKQFNVNEYRKYIHGISAVFTRECIQGMRQTAAFN